MLLQLAGLPAIARRLALLKTAPKLWTFPSKKAKEKVGALISTVPHQMNGSNAATAQDLHPFLRMCMYFLSLGQCDTGYKSCNNR
jgi:hypothetical protein